MSMDIAGFRGSRPRIRGRLLESWRPSLEPLARERTQAPDFSARPGPRRGRVADSHSRGDAARPLRGRDVRHEPRWRGCRRRRISAATRCRLRRARCHARRVSVGAARRTRGAASQRRRRARAAARAANALADLYAMAITDACTAAGVAPHDLVAAGVHGQTVRHRPEQGWTVAAQQSGAGRRARVRDGGRGFPQSRRRGGRAGRAAGPGISRRGVRSSRTVHRAVVNIGGIANLTDLPPRGVVRGFDTGPGNVLLDLWCARHRGAPFDAGGAWAAQGGVDDALLAALLAEPFFAAAPPKSTGRDLFHAAWLDARLRDARWQGRPEDAQATLAALTARSIADAVRAHATARDGNPGLRRRARTMPRCCACSRRNWRRGR